MAPSQLKRLKASLREQGIIGPQKSKKQKQKLAQDRKNGQDKRLQRAVALDGIRDQFNPFQFKTNARGPKFETTSITNPNAKAGARLGRPGASKAAGESKRRQTLLSEMHSRNKVGGIEDRRLGEQDPNMTAEERALQRFAREQQSSHKKRSIFDLEDEAPLEPLTHMGRALDLINGDRALVDDFDEADLPSDSDSGTSEGQRRKLKRARADSVGLDGDGPDGEHVHPDRKRTKQEVMQEVIAKSKLHKHERQAAKDADDDLRLEVDGEMSALQALLRAEKVDKPSQQPATTSGLAGFDKRQFEQTYDLRVRQMAQDKRAQPSERTKTAEELAEEEAERLRKLENKRMRRMAGEEVSDSDDDDDDSEGDRDGDATLEDGGASSLQNEVEQDYGLGEGIGSASQHAALYEDEDDFVIEEDLVASGSDIDDDDNEDEENPMADEEDFDEDDEFTKGLLSVPEEQSGAFKDQQGEMEGGGQDDGLPFTFPCPQSLEEFDELTKEMPLSKLSQVIQRIRALHHPSLAKENKEKLAGFARVLVQQIANMSNRTSSDANFSPALEGVMRHVHSLAKSFPIEISLEFRDQLEALRKDRALAPTVGDLAILTAIRLYPTSDHFHLVVTPAMLSIARYLGQKAPRDLYEYAVGTYLSILALDYQQRSARYIPELINFSLNTLGALAPVVLTVKSVFPAHESARPIRILNGAGLTVRKLSFQDCRQDMSSDETGRESLKVALVDTVIAVLNAAADLWVSKPAFIETFTPVVQVLQHLGSQPCRAHLPPTLQEHVRQSTAKLQRMLAAARLSRRPLELHHHRSMAIKTLIPKFEDSFDPSKHYDADRERAQMAKLRAEHKRERKGAIRELRKDAAFVARENLRVKKEKDAAYDKKYKRLVAEIQGEEGHEANLYEKEKSARKRARMKR
jgi:nucleolar protein 14